MCFHEAVRVHVRVTDVTAWQGTRHLMLEWHVSGHVSRGTLHDIPYSFALQVLLLLTTFLLKLFLDGWDAVLHN